MWFKFVFCPETMKKIQTVKINILFDVSPLNKRDHFLLHDNASLPCLESQKNDFFTICVMFWKVRRTYINFLIYNTLRTIVELSFSIFFWSSLSDSYFIPSQLYLSINGSIFVAVYWKRLLSFIINGIYCSFLFFIQSGESSYDPSRLKFILWHLYCKDKITTFHWFFLPNLIFRKKWLKALL